MGSFTKFMASAIFFIVLSFFLVPTRTQEEGFISVVISSQGLEFSKDLLIELAVSSITPLQLPQIEKSVKIPLVGQVHVVLSNITVYDVDIASSYVETGDSDNGDASIQVEGMEVGVTLALNGQEGTLKLSVLECGCYVKDISVKLDGGASWLYQGLVDAFEGQIVSAVEDSISKKIREGIMKLDSLLQSLPKQITLDDIAALNVTFVGNPVLSNSSIEFQINGLFMAPNDDFASRLYNKGSLDPVPFNAPAKMVEISLHENVFSSVALVFFNANYMQWVINKTPDQSLMNTAGWKYIVPQLYKQYPNEDMELNISVSSPPIMTVVNNGINITVYSGVTISVIDADEVIPVACISLEIHASCSPDILINKLAGTVKLNHVTAYLKWSKIGNLHMHLVQAILSTILKTVVVPYVNLHLWKGLPLPLPHGFTLHNSEVVSINSRLTIFSDVAIAERSPTSLCIWWLNMLAMKSEEWKR
ncbi:hypothetical protein Pyn_24089 [Prunus yedoensis var. nudiflora]|uniref:Lipid-binding serum glycoprotein C-terminal domain-containing protein n=1 Tax=Prunus yedoensis var. nudiflora TaxID=2094558 RepID=A0A314YBI0_PRUYE|nr:hypothetical protein Pyn_24089 [Prunus yedoensis var. nudiflora]